MRCLKSSLDVPAEWVPKSWLSNQERAFRWWQSELVDSIKPRRKRAGLRDERRSRGGAVITLQHLDWRWTGWDRDISQIHTMQLTHTYTHVLNQTQAIQYTCRYDVSCICLSISLPLIKVVVGVLSFPFSLNLSLCKFCSLPPPPVFIRLPFHVISFLTHLLCPDIVKVLI